VFARCPGGKKGGNGMVELHAGSQVEKGVIDSSLNDYHSKIGEIIRSENEKFRIIAEEQAKEIISKAWQQAEEVIRQSQLKADEILSQSEQRADEELTRSQRRAAEIFGDSEKKAARIVSDSHQKADEIIRDGQQQALSAKEEILNEAKVEGLKIIESANQQAQRIVHEAEENARREARNRTKAEEEKIIAGARGESDDIIAAAREEAKVITINAGKDAERQVHEAVESTKREAEALVKDEIEKYRAQARMNSDKIRLEAEKKADRLTNNIVNSGKDVSELISETMKNTESLMVRLKDEMSIEIGELTKNIVEAKKKLQDITDGYVGEYEKEKSLTQVEANANTNDYLWIIFKGEKPDAGLGENGYCNGEIELTTLSTFDTARMKSIKKDFNQIPSVKYLGESSSEEGTKISFELKKPLPLIEILRKMPSIDKISEEGGNLKLTVR
jgi:vacuolar-type H+-ATPase subunit H